MTRTQLVLFGYLDHRELVRLRKAFKHGSVETRVAVLRKIVAHFPEELRKAGTRRLLQ